MRLTYWSLMGILSICVVGCSVTPAPRAERLGDLPDSPIATIRFALRKGFWVYEYPTAVVVLGDDGEGVYYRMTAATGTAIGGRRLADYYREYWDTLHVGTQIRIIGVTRYKDGSAYIVRIEDPREIRLGNALIEIYDEADNYAVDQLPSGLPKLNEAYFQKMED